MAPRQEGARVLAGREGVHEDEGDIAAVARAHHLDLLSDQVQECLAILDLCVDWEAKQRRQFGHCTFTDCFQRSSQRSAHNAAKGEARRLVAC